MRCVMCMVCVVCMVLCFVAGNGHQVDAISALFREREKNKKNKELHHSEIEWGVLIYGKMVGK